MQTIWMLMAMYEGAPIVSVERVRNDFFGGMARRSFLGKVESGEIPLPLVRLGETQKAEKGFHLNDLAAYIDARAEAARKELNRKLS